MGCDEEAKFAFLRVAATKILHGPAFEMHCSASIYVELRQALKELDCGTLGFQTVSSKPENMEALMGQKEKDELLLHPDSRVLNME